MAKRRKIHVLIIFFLKRLRLHIYPTAPDVTSLPSPSVPCRCLIKVLGSVVSRVGEGVTSVSIGISGIGDESGLVGLAVLIRVNALPGQISDELMGVSSNLYKNKEINRIS